MSARAPRSRRFGLATVFWILVLVITAPPDAGAAAGTHAGIRRVVEHGGYGIFHCAWRQRTVPGMCRVSHEHVVSRDPDVVGLYGNGGSTATLDVIVIRWPAGKVTRVIEGDDWEWADLEHPAESAYHSAMYWDGKGVDWSRGFILLDDGWKELIRVW
jgi:hypothetical protein